jgi:hypothetical protein
MGAKFFIFNRGSISQAGRRGFESHLPLQLFNQLQASRQPVGSNWLHLHYGED